MAKVREDVKKSTLVKGDQKLVTHLATRREAEVKASVNVAMLTKEDDPGKKARVKAVGKAASDAFKAALKKATARANKKPTRARTGRNLKDKKTDTKKKGM
jgi:hypothetical protein